MNTMISFKNPCADTYICNSLIQTLTNSQRLTKPLVFFCIGSSKVTGDALGPLVGSFLTHLHRPEIQIYGTYQANVHALNINTILETAKKKHPDACFIAIDASFGPKSLLGNICIHNHALQPGKGVGKTLPHIGDISITSIVCPDCHFRYRRLMNTPFSEILTQANVIASGIHQAILKLSYFKNSFTDWYTP